jgi:hypothetical protein
LSPFSQLSFVPYFISDGEFNGLQIKAGSLIFNILTYPQHVRQCGENIRQTNKKNNAVYKINIARL